MANDWTPPSDAVETNSSFVPPSDAVEVKKKDPTGSGSKIPSSVRLSTTTTIKPSASSSSRGLPDGLYSFPGQENATYKKEKGDWSVAFDGSYKYIPLYKGDVQARVANLEKNAVSLEQYGFETKPRKEEQPKYTEAPKPKAIAKPKTEAQKKEQQLFETEFKALDLNDPEYLRRKARSEKIDKLLAPVTGDLIDYNEGNVVPVIDNIIKQYPYLEVSESGVGYDELKIRNKVTGEKAVINLDNWTSGRDEEEAKQLRAFLDVQINSKDYVAQKQKVDELQAQMQDATPTQRIDLSQQLLEEKAKLNDLSGARYNYAKNDKYKAAAIYDKNAKENVKVDYANLQLRSIDYAEKVKSYNEWNQKVNEAREKGLITQEQYDTQYAPKLAAEKNMLNDERFQINDSFNQVRSDSTSIDNIAASEYAVQAEKGNVLSGATYSLLEGAENSLRFLLETGDFKDGDFKGLLTQAAPGSISDVYTSAEGRNAFEQIIFGLANSGGSALVGAAAGSPFLGLYASSYVNMKDQMSTPQFKDVPEYQKMLMAGVYGGTVGLLEQYGISKWFTKTPAGKGLTNWILKKTISELGEDATTETIELAVKKNLGAAIKNGLIQVTASGLVEGSTELAQEGADMIYKDVFNKLAEKKYFDNPTSWAGVADRLSQSFILGFAGGAGMQSITQATQVGMNELNKNQINNLTELIDSPELKDVFRLNLKDQILSGQISKEEAQRQIFKINEIEGALNKIPSNVDKFEAFKLINERDAIQKEIAGKDPALVAAQTERVNAINDELKQLSYAVQEQATSEVPVQPGAESGGEMAQGEPEAGPQEVTQEGEQEKVTAQINVAPLFDTKVTNVQEAEAIRNSEVYQQYKKDMTDTAKQFGVEVDAIDDTIGGYAGTSEVSTVVNVTGDWNNIIEFAAAYGSMAPEVQDSTIAGRTVEAQATEHNADRFDIGIDNQEAALKAAEDAGFSQDGFTMSGDKIMFFNIFDFPVENFDEKYATFVDKYIEYGGKITSESKSAVQSEFIDSFRRAEILTEAERNAVQQTGREGVRDVLKKAKERNFPYTVAKAKADQINLVTDKNIDEVIENQDNATKQGLAKNAKLVMKAIPGVKIYLHNNTAEYNGAIGEETDGTERGTFIGKDMAIHVDMSEAFPHTLLHEAFHYVILNKGIDGKTLNAWAKSLRSIIKDEKVISRLDKLLKNYSAEKQPEEFISELGAIIGSSKSKLTTSLLQKFKTLINKIAKAIGLPAIFTAASTTQDAVDFINTISKQLVTGDQIFANGFQTKIVPADLERKKQIKVTEDQKLTFVKQSDIIDFKSLVDDIISKDQTVWFWVADQLGRGMYFDSELNGNHYLDAGPSFALDPENRKDGIIWASGANKSTLEKNINNSDYIFIISGSPQQSKLFNKTVSSLVRSKIEAKVDFDKFKSSILEAKPTKAIKEILEKYNSYDEVFLGADRKKFIIAINEQKSKGTPVKKLLESYDAFLETNELRDGFFKDNDFKMGDVMLVLKPTAVGGKSKHSTYENDILGEVVGVPDIIVNSYDIMPQEVRNKYRDDLDRAQQQQVVAPYGIGLKKIQQVPERKKQKGFSKQEAIRKAKEKYLLSVKERGNTPEQGVTSALEDLRKSEWYNEADDIMREEAERELNKFFDQKMKAAPSINKIMAIKPTNIQVNEAAALKSQLRLEARAARDAKSDLNQKRRAIGEYIKSLETNGKIKAKQTAVLLKKLSTLNLDNPVMVDRFLAYAEKVFLRADFQERLSDATKVRRMIVKALKGDNQAEVAAMAKAFTKIDPLMVEDIDGYTEIANKVLNAVRPTKTGEFELRIAADIESVSEYTNNELERQEENKKKELMELNKYLVESGAITEEMTAKEMQEIIDIINTPDDKIVTNEKKIAFLKGRINSLLGFALEMEDAQGIDLIKQIEKMDLDQIDMKGLARMSEALDNFVNNEITSGLEAAVKAYQGAQNATKLVKTGMRSRPLKMYFNKAAGRLMAEQFVSLPLLVERMFNGMTRGLKVMQAMGLNDLMRGVATADRQHKMTVKSYTEQEFFKQKGFKDAYNVYERGMLAFLKRGLAGSKSEMRNEFLRRIKLLQESIEVLRSGSDSEQKMADIYQEAYDNLKVSSQDMDVITANAKEMNTQAVDWMIKEWSKLYNDLSDVSLSVYNSILGSDTSYTPDRYKTLDDVSAGVDEELTKSGSAFMGGLEYTDKNKSGVLIESTRPKTLPIDRYVSLDFDTNNFSSMKGAMIDIETAAAIRQVDGFLKSKAFKSLVTTSEDRKLLASRINTYILSAKSRTNFTGDTLKYVDRFANFLAGLGVGKALGGLDQPIKQTAPVIVNTLINAGRFTPLDFKMNEAINRSGMPIANRGLESVTAVESIDSIIDKKGTKAAEALKFVEKVNQIYMKTLLSKPDIWVARSSFITYYQKFLRDNGMSTEIDWEAHEWNQEAMDYAQMMVDRQQNISDEKLAGSFMTSRDPLKSVTRKVLMPFATFVLNQKARMHNDFVALLGSGTSNQDRIKALKSIGGLASEMLAYQAIAYFIKTQVYDRIAEMITGEDDDEEEKDKSFFGIKMTKKQWNATKFPMKSFISDLLSPLPITDEIVVSGFDMLMERYPMISDDEIKKQVQDRNEARLLKGDEPMDSKQEAKFIEQLKLQNTYSVAFNRESLGKSLGVAGIAIDTYLELSEMTRMAYTGEFEDDMGYGPKTKHLTKEGQELVKDAIPWMLAYSTGLVPKDVGVVARKVVSAAKKDAISESKNEGITNLKKELGRTPKAWEESLVLNTTKKINTITDAIAFAERFGGLTESQGKEFAKLIELTGDYGYMDLKRIQDNETADQILKK